MYINPILSEIYASQNKQYEYGRSINIDINQKQLQELGIEEFKHVKAFDRSVVQYFTGFKKFCSNKQSNIRQIFLTNKYNNYQNIKNKYYNLFQFKQQIINHGNQDNMINICHEISWERSSKFIKNIQIIPLSYYEYFK